MSYQLKLNYIFTSLFVLFLAIYFFYKLLLGENNIFYLNKFENKICQKEDKLTLLRSQNLMLAEKIEFLKANPLAYEEHARNMLGMIKPGEKYYQVVLPVQ